ncbi:hypothetical protein [Halomarina rubra]|uniref:DUF4129 domain-containing protein n=1 Tax=Halomarina rubra TaxID=2071873 RepID=A0ABD6AWJ9_9EURY|nr:hypothetical protein [Halomarina rubra]
MNRSVALCCVVLVVLASPIGVVLAETGPASDRTSAYAQDGPNGTSASNNTSDSIAHRNPDIVGQEGDAAALQDWLIGQLAGRLGEGSIQLSQGEYDAARKLLGDKYNDRLGQLVDVAGETDSTRTFRRTRNNQRELTNATEDYRDTYEKYREARENGNNSQARELARDLEEDASRVRENAGRTRDGYGQLGNQTGQDFADARDSVTAVEQNITDTQEEVREATFEETTLSVRADGQQASFLDPLALSGTLTTENGSAVTTEEIRLQIGSQSYRTTTDENGAFSIEYRPTTLPTNATNITVGYRPVSTSPYLNSSDTIPIQVEQVTPNISIDTAPTETRYNQTVTVTGQVRAEGIGASVPVAVRLGETRLTTAQSREDGSYQVTVRIPAGIDEGTRNLVVSVAQENRALASTSASSTLQVDETPTALMMEAFGTDAQTIRVSGTLRTTDGQAVGGQRVALSIGGNEIETVRTNRDGDYNTEVALPQDFESNGTVEVQATFSDEGTNLGSSAANATVSVSSAGGNTGLQSPSSGLSLEQFLTLVGGVVTLILVAVFGVRYWSRSSEPKNIAPAPASTPVESTTEQQSRSEIVQNQLESARELLSEGQSDAGLVTTYAAVRASLKERVARTGLTHWEFYNESAAVLSNDERSFLERLTSAYEQAQFSRESVSQQTAQDLHSSASDTVESDSGKSTDLSE